MEFGLVSAPFIALLMATLQTSLVFFAQQALETVAQKSVRQLRTGVAQKAGTNQAQFKTMVCGNLPSLLQCNNVLVDVQVASAFSAANTATPTITFDSNGNPNNTFAYAPGGPGQITVVKIMYMWDVRTGPLGFDLRNMSSGKRLLISTYVFKTERYT